MPVNEVFQKIPCAEVEHVEHAQIGERAGTVRLTELNINLKIHGLPGCLYDENDA